MYPRGASEGTFVIHVQSSIIDCSHCLYSAYAESDSAAFALRGFPGVLQQQVRSAKQPKPPAAGAGDATTAATEEALQQAVE